MKTSTGQPLSRRAALRSMGVGIALITSVAAGGCASQIDDRAPRIIVSGASGQIGGLVVEELLARGVQPADLILVSRTPERLERYAELGASTS